MGKKWVINSEWTQLQDIGDSAAFSKAVVTLTSVEQHIQAQKPGGGLAGLQQGHCALRNRGFQLCCAFCCWSWTALSLAMKPLQLPSPSVATGMAQIYLQRSLWSQLRAWEKSKGWVKQQSVRGGLGFQEGKGIRWGEGKEQDVGLGSSFLLSGISFFPSRLTTEWEGTDSLILPALLCPTGCAKRQPWSPGQGRKEAVLTGRAVCTQAQAPTWNSCSLRNSPSSRVTKESGDSEPTSHSVFA